jgi:processive 1,2-diacylglycerol beta-glucosyltransferase
MSKRLLILSVSAGHGHVVASKALVEAAERYHPEIEVKYIDVLDLMPYHIVLGYRNSYNFMVKYAPFLWKLAYNLSDHNKPESVFVRARKKIERAAADKLLRSIQDYNPDDIICPHFMPAQLVQNWRDEGKLKARLWEVVTDYMSHRFWQIKGINGFFVATDAVKQRLLDRGHREVIAATGIPVMPKFGDKYSRSECAEKFGINPNMRTLLLVGGGAGIGGLREVAEQLVNISEQGKVGEFQLIVLCGTNEALLKKLQKSAESHKGKLFPMGFTKEFEKLLAVSDLVLTKPGGLTVSECMAMGKPMILFAPIPGQEEHNANFLLSNNIAVRAHSLDELKEQVNALLSQAELLAKLAENSVNHGKAKAAKEILEIILKAG